MVEIDLTSAEAVIQRIAQIAETFAAQAGVGGMETAGNLVSYLAKHPRDIEPCLKFGIFELPADWHERGDLTWHALSGKIVRPEAARRARTIKKLEKARG